MFFFKVLKEQNFVRIIHLDINVLKVCTTPFGISVVPEVNKINAVCSK